MPFPLLPPPSFSRRTSRLWVSAERKMQAEEGPSYLSISPTFNSCSSGSSNLAEIAARVVRELGEEPFLSADTYDWESQGSILHFQETISNVHAMELEEEGQGDNVDGKGDDDDDDDDEEFEFAVLCGEPDASTISANEIFYNGQIRPVYPIFNMDSLLNNGSQKAKGLEKLKTTPTVRRLPLRMLMNEERATTSSSSSKADDLEGVPSDMYCVWSPKTEKTSPGRCKKSKSTSSSNRWKLRNILYNHNQSKSEGDDAFLFWTPSNKKDDRAGNVSNEKERRSGSGIGSPARKAHYGRNADKRMSYLPYKQGLVGCVADVNATAKYIRPV